MPTMIQSIVRPEKVHDVMKALLDAGFPAVTKMDVFGRGKQRGRKVGEITYDELPKEQLLMVVADADKDLADGNFASALQKATAVQAQLSDGEKAIADAVMAALR